MLFFIRLYSNGKCCNPNFLPCIKDLHNLEKLDLRLNKQLVIPGWLQQLEQRGCTVFI